MYSKVKLVCLFLFGSLVFLGCTDNDGLPSEEAHIQYKKLQAKQREDNNQNNGEGWPEYAFKSQQLVSKIKGHHEDVLYYYHHTGYHFRIQEQYRESLMRYEKFFDYYHTHEDKFSPELKKEFRVKRSFNYRGVAIAYEQLGHLDSANLEHQKNLNFVKECDSLFIAAAHNDYGIFLIGGIRDTVSALKEFNLAFQIVSERFPDHNLIGSIRDNIAKIYFAKHMLDESYNLFYINYYFYKKHLKRNPIDKYEWKAVESAVKVLEILRLQNKLVQLDTFYDEAVKFYNTSIHVDNKTAKVRLGFLNIEMQYLLAHSDFERSHQILETIKSKSDSMNFSKLRSNEKRQVKMNDLTLNSIETSFRLEKKQKEAMLLSQRLTIGIISIVSIASLGILAFLFYRRKQRFVHAQNKLQIAEQERELTSIKNQQLNMEIESKKRDLSDFAINLTQNQEWAKVLAIKLKQLKTTKGRVRKRLMDDFENEVINKTTFDTDTQEFFERLDKLSDSFYSSLGAQFPNLSKTERRLCSLIRLKMESRDIAKLQNITFASLNTSRYRLRKKLKLTKETGLDDFIQSL